MKEINEMKKFNTHQIMIFDMDGTLYVHDGENGTIKNSSLFKNVISNSIEFVISKEQSSREVATKLIDEALGDSIGISNVLSKRYGISRSDYFDIAWNINPKKVVKNFEKQITTVQKLKINGQRMFLLTAAPRIWMENVVRDLGIEQVFERKYHGEMFAKKDEVFEALAREFEPKSMLSVGDQLESDIWPAQKFGINTLLVKNPEDLLKLT